MTSPVLLDTYLAALTVPLVSHRCLSGLPLLVDRGGDTTTLISDGGDRPLCSISFSDNGHGLTIAYGEAVLRLSTLPLSDRVAELLGWFIDGHALDNEPEVAAITNPGGVYLGGEHMPAGRCCEQCGTYPTPYRSCDNTCDCHLQTWRRLIRHWLGTTFGGQWRAESRPGPCADPTNTPVELVADHTVVTYFYNPTDPTMQCVIGLESDDDTYGVETWAIGLGPDLRQTNDTVIGVAALPAAAAFGQALVELWDRYSHVPIPVPAVIDHTIVNHTGRPVRVVDEHGWVRLILPTTGRSDLCTSTPAATATTIAGVAVSTATMAWNIEPEPGVWHLVPAPLAAMAGPRPDLLIIDTTTARFPQVVRELIAVDATALEQSAGIRNLVLLGTALSRTQCDELHVQGRAEAALSPHVNPKTVAAAIQVLGARGEAWAQQVLGRSLVRRSQGNARYPWFDFGEMETLKLADAAEPPTGHR